MTQTPERNNRRAYLIQRHYSQNKSDNYYLGALATGMALGGLMNQSAVIVGWTFATASLFWSLYEFHGETIQNKFNEKFYGQVSELEQVKREQEEEENTVSNSNTSTQENTESSKK